MRVSTAQIYAQGLRGFQTQQTNIARLQLQLSSGEKHLRPSDDPTEVARSLELDQIVSRTTQYLGNTNAAESRLQLEESTLASVNNSLIRVRELAVQGASTILPQDARQALVIELRERVSELFSLANSVDPQGDYLFAGNQGNSLPLTQRSVSDYTLTEFVGDQGSRRVQVSESDQIETGDSGSDVFFKIPSSYAAHAVAELSNTGSGQVAPVFRSGAAPVTGNNYRIDFTSATTFNIVNETTAATVSSGLTYTSGQSIEFEGLRTTLTGTPASGDVFRVRNGQYQDVFTTLNKMILALENGAATEADRNRLTTSMQQSIDDIDNALTHVNTFRTRVGGRINIIDAHREQSEAYLVDARSAISLLRDVDYAEAVTTLQQNTLSLQAAQAAFARLEGNSLFNFL